MLMCLGLARSVVIGLLMVNLACIPLRPTTNCVGEGGESWVYIAENVIATPFVDKHHGSLCVV